MILQQFVQVQGPDGLAPDLQPRGAGAQPQVDSLQDGGGDHDHQRGRGGQRLCRYLDIYISRYIYAGEVVGHPEDGLGRVLHAAGGPGPGPGPCVRQQRAGVGGDQIDIYILQYL